MSSQHPTYPNPTIIEAACDIRFRLAEGREWKAYFFGEVFRHIQNEYPNMQPAIETGYWQYATESAGTNTNYIPDRPKVFFKHRIYPLMLQLTEDGLSVSMLPPYRSWNFMRRNALAAWQLVGEVLQPAAITRIGVRYINKIKKDVEPDFPGQWLVANEYICKSILHSAPGFFQRLETHVDTENGFIISLGDRKTQVNKDGDLIFDIDCIFEKELPVEQNLLEQEMDRLHAQVWEIFSSTKSEKLEALLNSRSS